MSDPSPLHCVNHPKRETLIRCGKCEDPVCIECQIVSPVGIRCRKCGIYRPVQYQVQWFLYLPAIIVGIAAGAIGGFIGSRIGFFSVFLGPMIGSFIGEGIARVTRGKRGPGLALVAGCAVVVGAFLIPPLMRPPIGLFLDRLLSQLTNVWAWLYVVFAAPAAYWRLR